MTTKQLLVLRTCSMCLFAVCYTYSTPPPPPFPSLSPGICKNRTRKPGNIDSGQLYHNSWAPGSMNVCVQLRLQADNQIKQPICFHCADIRFVLMYLKNLLDVG